MDVSWGVVALLGCILVVGAITQSLAGFGIAVVGAPFAVIFAPELMPGAMLVASLPMPLIEVARRWRDADVRVLTWALAGRVLTTPVGVLIVAALSPSAIGVVVGVMVLIAVGASLRAFRVRPGRVPALGAGLLTGVSGTAASIGGPFLALVLQHHRPAQIRATLGAFFMVGASTGITALGLAGELHREDVVVGLAWMPFILGGMLLSIPLRRRMRPHQIRPAVLTVAAVAGVAVILRATLLA